MPPPTNEPNLTYAPGTPERAEIKKRLADMAAERIEIPLVIGGREVRTGKTGQAVMPHKHAHVLATYHKAGRRKSDRPFRRRSAPDATGRTGRGRTALPCFSAPPNC